MLRVALTGGIATGKSYALARLHLRNIPVIDADDIVHRLLQPGTAVTQAIAARFGSSFLNADGSVNRPLLAAHVFGEKTARRELESLIHPKVYDAIMAWFDGLDAPVAVASIPLLYETGRESDFDFVAATVCPPELQVRRIALRDGASAEDARRRIEAQMPALEKAARADFVIDTSGSRERTDAQVDELILVLQQRAAGRA